MFDRCQLRTVLLLLLVFLLLCHSKAEVWTEDEAVADEVANESWLGSGDFILRTKLFDDFVKKEIEAERASERRNSKRKSLSAKLNIHAEKKAPTEAKADVRIRARFVADLMMRGIRVENFVGLALVLQSNQLASDGGVRYEKFFAAGSFKPSVALELVRVVDVAFDDIFAFLRNVHGTSDESRTALSALNVRLDVMNMECAPRCTRFLIDVLQRIANLGQTINALKPQHLSMLNSRLHALVAALIAAVPCTVSVKERSMDVDQAQPRSSSAYRLYKHIQSKYAVGDELQKIMERRNISTLRGDRIIESLTLRPSEPIDSRKLVQPARNYFALGRSLCDLAKTLPFRWAKNKACAIFLCLFEHHGRDYKQKELPIPFEYLVRGALIVEITVDIEESIKSPKKPFLKRPRWLERDSRAQIAVGYAAADHRYLGFYVMRVDFCTVT